MNPSLITVIFVGRICSGKSTIAKALSNEISFPIASFGGYLKNLAINTGLPTKREDLQNLGQSFIENNASQFLLDVLSFTGKSDRYIIEGVRHLAIFNAVKRISNNVITFYMDVPFQIRYERLVNREGEPLLLTEFEKQDNHNVEKEIEVLKPLCDYILDGTDNISKLLQIIKEKMHK